MILLSPELRVMYVLWEHKRAMAPSEPSAHFERMRRPFPELPLWLKSLCQFGVIKRNVDGSVEAILTEEQYLKQQISIYLTEDKEPSP